MITLTYENNDESLSMKFNHEGSLDYLIIKLQEFVSIVEGETVFLEGKYPWEKCEPVTKKTGKAKKK
jgi:hypothetical protein